MTTLMQSAAPMTTNVTSDIQNDVENAKTIVPNPKIATEMKSCRPTWFSSGNLERKKVIAKAPRAGADCSSPNPVGPTRSMSFAKIGSIAVAPPSSTANKSKDMAPRITGFAAIKWMPARSESLDRARLTGTRIAGIVATETLATTKNRVATE